MRRDAHLSMHDNAGTHARGLQECAGYRLGLANREFTCGLATEDGGTLCTACLHDHRGAAVPPYLNIDRARHGCECSLSACVMVTLDQGQDVFSEKPCNSTAMDEEYYSWW